MIGLSLSGCVRDIAAGRVAEEDVEKIISSTASGGYSEFKKIIAIYSWAVWASDPEKSARIAIRLWVDSKIEQPRILNPSYVSDLSNGIWISEEVEPMPK